MKPSSVKDNVPVPTRGDRRFYAHFSELSFAYEGQVEEVPIRLPDVSVHGMFIQTPRHFAEGAILKVRFRLERSRHEVRARAEVRYCLRGVGVGVEFVDISAEDLEAIESELRDVETAPHKTE
jgi:hypothetical protein